MNIEHSYFQSAAQAFINYLDVVFKPFSEQIDQKFPIFILNTGDEAFLTNKYSVDKPDKKTETLYALRPHMNLDVKGFNIDASQFTAKNALGTFTAKNADEFAERFVAPVRRIPVNWVFSAEVTFNNIIEFLTFTEVFLTASHHDHFFTFYYAGTEFNCTFFLQEDLESTANMMLQFDAEKRKRTLPLTFVLSLQYPSFNIYKRGLYQDASIPAGQTMIKLLHNIDVENCAAETVDHIHTETTENGTKMV